MPDKSASSTFGKWLTGIAATVIGAVLIWLLTHPGGLINPTPTPIPPTPTPVIMDVSGVWLTPFNDLSYKVTQDQSRVEWLIRESGVSGEGTIRGKTLVGDLGGQEVTYEVGESDSKGNPTVLYTTHPNYLGVILFRTCDDFGKYLTDVGGISPQLKTMIYDAVKSLPNPTCPNVLH